MIHQDTQGSGKGQHRRCSRRQTSVHQMLNAIPGIDHLARVCVCVRVWAHQRETGSQIIWEYLNAPACESGRGRDMRDPAACVAVGGTV